MYLDYCKILGDFCKDIFEQWTNTSVSKVSIKRDQRPDSHYAFASTIQYRHQDNKVCGSFTLGFNDQDIAAATASTMAEKMNALLPSGLDWMAQDLLNEFLNTVFGLAVSAWEKNGLKVDISSPKSARNYTANTLVEMDAESYVIILHLSIYHIVFRISFSEANTNLLQNKKVLVVDDSSVIRQVICKQLKSLGLEVEQAKNGVSAIDKFIQFQPDLTIMDQVMPEMNGLDAIVDIRQFQPNAKIIMLTSVSRIDEIVTAETLGVCRYLLKPMQSRDLIRAVNELLSGEGLAPALGQERVAFVN